MALTTLRHGAMPTGSVLQVVQTALTSALVLSTPTSFTDVTGLSVAITPKFSSSKVLIDVNLVGEVENNTFHAIFRLLRGSTAIGIGDSVGSRPQGSFMLDSYASGGSLAGIAAGFHFLDSPSTTSATTYKIQVQAHSGSGDVAIGRNHTDTNAAGGTGRFPSIITATEIAG
tara:strand:+ start:35 stop:550 length:516 start_codon:yes stop_codon:yes gene_type:complete